MSHPHPREVGLVTRMGLQQKTSWLVHRFYSCLGVCRVVPAFSSYTKDRVNQPQAGLPMGHLKTNGVGHVSNRQSL